MEAVAFPKMDAVLVAFLNAQFAARSEPARAATRVPEGRGPFVKVTRVGGTRKLVHEEAMVTFECWDTSQSRAADLAILTRALIGSLDLDDVWYGREVGGVSFFPDELSDDPRYQFTALIRARGKAI